MSFGDESTGVPRLFQSAATAFDSVLGPAFGPMGKTKAPDAPPATSSAPPPSLVTRPVSADTPGRHKTLLGR